MKNFMAKIVALFIIVFATTTANAQGVLVPKHLAGKNRDVYVAVIAVGGSVAAALAAAHAEQNATNGKAPSGTTLGAASSDKLATAGKPPSGTTTGFTYIPQW